MTDSAEFSGLVAVVVGGGSGIGAACADVLAERGAHVVVTGPDGDRLAEVARRCGGIAVPADASTATGCALARDAALERWGRIDALVCSAGIGSFGTVTDAAEEVWHQTLTANLDTAYASARACLPALQVQGGSIVLISSVAGRLAVPGSAAYVTSKHAVIGLMRSLAADYGPHGVRANAVCPGLTRTAMSDHVMTTLGAQAGLDQAGAYRRAAALSPLRRVAEPREVAEVVAFLAGPRSSIVTGAVLMADGGSTAVDLSLSALVGPAGP